MAYILKKGNKNILGETFKTESEARKAKYQVIIGGKNFKQASPYLEAKIVKVATKKKK